LYGIGEGGGWRGGGVKVVTRTASAVKKNSKYNWYISKTCFDI
jgi:hypothetical protein